MPEAAAPPAAAPAEFVGDELAQYELRAVLDPNHDWMLKQMAEARAKEKK
jgi:hypothetical protein